MFGIKRAITPALLLSISICIAVLDAAAQSLEISAPAPITASELAGRITARDIGDARYTDHYYTFVGNPGDLIVTVESRNLNGDVDVFTSVGLRPLLKFTVYAESSAPIRKSIFLRRREELILRVEARTPNDDEGVYRVTFGGSFEALPQSLLADSGTQPSESEIASTSSSQKGRRVSSVGARINEPEPPPQEVVAVPTPEPSPESRPTTETPAASEPERTSTPTRTPRRTAGRRSRSRPPATETAETAKPKTETETAATPEEKPAEPTSTRRSTSRRAQPRPTVEQPAEQEPDVGPRLVIETADGTLINKSMSTVRRVMVENGWVVVVSKDGRIQRILLSQIVRMSITPQ